METQESFAGCKLEPLLVQFHALKYPMAHKSTFSGANWDGSETPTIEAPLIDKSMPVHEKTKTIMRVFKPIGKVCAKYSDLLDLCNLYVGDEDIDDLVDEFNNPMEPRGILPPELTVQAMIKSAQENKIVCSKLDRYISEIFSSNF